MADETEDTSADSEMPDEDAEEADLEDEAAEDPGAEDEDEPGPDDAEEGLAGEEPAAAAPRGRASETIRATRARAQKAEKDAKDAADRAANLERELSEIRARQNQPSAADIERQAAEERERLALMTPEERIDYRFNQLNRNIQTANQRTQAQITEANDKAAFQALQATDPFAKRYASEVEAVVASELKRGQVVSRENVLNFLAGKKLREKAGSAGTKQAEAGARRVARATTRPSRAAGDEPADRGNRRGGNDEAALARRLGIQDF